MNNFLNETSRGIVIFFEIYLLIYSSFLFLSVTIGAWNLYKSRKMHTLRNELKHKFYIPVSIIVPAFNEEVTIMDTVNSLLELDYELYEIIVVDDGSEDQTTLKLINSFDLKPVNFPIRLVLKSEPYTQVHETYRGNIKITLITKLNGGKGDALNMGINASQFPYFLTIDADSILQRDSLEKIVQPVFKDPDIIAVGGFINVGQSAKIRDGKIEDYHIPWNPIVSMQIAEYYRSFLASKILLNQFNGNLIISGAFGLFKKDVVIEAGGYSADTLGEDMDIVLKLHSFCRNNNRRYSIEYEPNAICWSEVPSSLEDLFKQRQRWYLGLFQSMSKYSFIFMNMKFGKLSLFSYMYYLFYELLSPVVEVLGILMIGFFFILGSLNVAFMIKFFFLYSIYGVLVSITAFWQMIFTENIKINKIDIIKITVFSLIEGFVLRYILSFIRIMSFIKYEKKKMHWGTIKRSGHR